MRGSFESGARLVFAISHEVGNHLGGIRLQAHLLDEELGAREMAAASVLIDDLAGRSGPLLALLRPLLSDDWRGAGGVDWASVLGRVARQIEDEGTRGISFEVAGDLDTPIEAPDHDWLHPLLIVLIQATLEHLTGGSREVGVRLVLAEEASGARLALEDQGAEEDLSDGAALRGRPLAVAIARELVERAGGRVETARDGETTSVSLVFP